YKKDQSELQEFKQGQDEDPHVVLKWPIEIGNHWKSKGEGRIFNSEIISLSTHISVSAGDFDQCLLVRSFATGDTAAKNEYYAPGVGRVLTSLTSPKGEKRITELSSFHIKDVPQ